MREVFVESFNIVTGLGASAEANFDKIIKGESGISQHNRKDIDDELIWASLIEQDDLNSFTDFIKDKERYTKYEKLLIASISESAQKSQTDLTSRDTVFILSSTKGNISLLEDGDVTAEIIDRINLFHSGKIISEYFGNKNEPVIISNACISGVVALLYAKRLLSEGAFKTAVVAGADVISRFVYSGFKSFQALSAGRCSPFSENRDGINLGEAAATIILNADNTNSSVRVKDGSVSNDSNHISGPSRSGYELSHAIDTALQLSGIQKNELGFISAHGTATLFNDEMEAKAFHTSGLSEIPINSLKGYFGHTLGAD